MSQLFKCNWCGGSGVVFAVHKFNHGASEYVFKCRCSNARHYKVASLKLPVWTEERHNRYIPEFAKDEPRHKAFLQKRSDATEIELASLIAEKQFRHPKVLHFLTRHSKDELRALYEKHKGAVAEKKQESEKKRAQQS